LQGFAKGPRRGGVYNRGGDLTPMRTRRAFLKSSLQASLALSAAGAFRPASLLAAPQSPPEPRPRLDVIRGPLTQRFPDLRRHFLFEYYPWYGGPPAFRHWDQFDRVPPLDLASNYVPRLGAYDSRSAAVLEQHARWMVEAGAGAISLSWWGPESYEDAGVNLVMDVMKDHGLKVAFHMEPYAADRGQRWSSDVLYLLREYGERRRWDAMLLLRDADGSEGPLFKGFSMILPERVRDCHGVEHRVEGFTADSTWRRQNESVREALRRSFDHVTLLSDSLNYPRAAASGFDGIAIYDHFIAPSSYASIAAAASHSALLFSLNVNPGFDTIEPREVDPEGCYAPTPFAPPTPGIDFGGRDERERAAMRSMERIDESFAAAMAVQVDPGLRNFRRGFLLVYLNSFNEWHEGHSFEPMKDAAALDPVERAFGYHNPARGDYRLQALAGLLQPVVDATRAGSESRRAPDPQGAT
jgi:hypothetical protein